MAPTAATALSLAIGALDLYTAAQGHNDDI